MTTDEERNIPIRDYLRPRLKEAFGWTFWFFLVLALGTGAAVYQTKGGVAVEEAIEGALELIVSIAPRLAAAFLIAGFIRAMVSQEFVAEWLGRKSRLRGIVIGELAGIVTPGGPATAFSLIAALKVAGADRGVLVAYAISWALLGFQRILLWDLPLLGSDFTVTRMLSSVAFPLAAGLLARYIPIDIYADVIKNKKEAD